MVTRWVLCSYVALCVGYQTHFDDEDRDDVDHNDDYADDDEHESGDRCLLC